MSTDWDITDWTAFLEMLSVERTAPLTWELALPFETENFSQVMRMARACLEVYIFPYASLPNIDDTSPGLTKAWRSYRQAEGVLDDAALREFTLRYPHADEAVFQAYKDFQDWVGADTAKALKRWFLEHPDPYSYLHHEWVWTLRDFFVGSPPKLEASAPSPLTGEQRRCVERFYSQCQFRNHQLDLRFYVGAQVASFSLPTRWERVLQAFPADGPIHSFPWLDYIRDCLQLRVIRQEWGGMKEVLGDETLAHLTVWVRQQARLHLDGKELPPEPQSLWVG